MVDAGQCARQQQRGPAQNHPRKTILGPAPMFSGVCYASGIETIKHFFSIKTLIGAPKGSP